MAAIQVLTLSLVRVAEVELPLAILRAHQTRIMAVQVAAVEALEKAQTQETTAVLEPAAKEITAAVLIRTNLACGYVVAVAVLRVQEDKARGPKTLEIPT
jgi:hypothetical protein